MPHGMPQGCPQATIFQYLLIDLLLYLYIDQAAFLSRCTSLNLSMNSARAVSPFKYLLLLVYTPTLAIHKLFKFGNCLIQLITT